MTTELFDVLKLLAKKTINKHRLLTEVDDFTNECILRILESGESITLESFTNVSKKIIQETINNNRLDLPIYETKFCKCCKEDYPIAAFGVTSRNDGKKQIFQTYCNNCMALKFRQYYKNNKQLINDRNRDYFNQYYKTKKYKDRRREYMKKYQKENREKINERRRKVY